jgi:hypothetical protein
MGIEFVATDSRNPRTFRGHTFPGRVELDGILSDFNLNMGSAYALFGLLTAALTFKGKAAPSLFADSQSGAITIAEGRRAVCAARSRFNELRGSIVEDRDQAFEIDSPRYHSLGFDSEDLRIRLSKFSAFIELAAASGADGISWG